MKPTPFVLSPARLRVKKLARRCAVRLGRALGPPREAPGGSVRVLTYHRFGDSALDPCCVRPDTFAEQLTWLSAHATVLTPSGFDAVMSGAAAAPPDAVLITIDDGHASVAEHALPALRRVGLSAVLFVCTQFAETGRATPADPTGAFMGWDRLAAAASAGHAIASHGDTHRSLGRLPFAEALADIDRAGDAIARRFDTHGPFFSFPFGTRADYSPELAAALAERGYRYCFTSAHGRCLPGAKTVLLPRVKIEGGNEQDLFPDIVRGCIDHWRVVDATLSFLQQRGRL